MGERGGRVGEVFGQLEKRGGRKAVSMGKDSCSCSALLQRPPPLQIGAEREIIHTYFLQHRLQILDSSNRLS